MKKIVLVSMVKNEADIIESFVRHSLTYAAELIIADHQSSDGTWEMLQKLRAEGLPLTLERLYRVELAHREVMNRLTRNAIEEHGADIVLPFDADEFLVNTETDVPCRQILEHLDVRKLYGLHWRTYEPVDPEEARDTFLLARPCRRSKGFSANQKTIVGARGYIEGRPYELVQGAHYGVYLDDGQQVPMEFVPFLHTAHFHWRSRDQYESKIATSWLNNVAKYTVHTITAAYLKGTFDLLRRHEIPEREDAPKDMERFDLAPHVPSQALRYTSGAPADLLSNLMAAAEQISEQLAETKVLQRKKLVSMILVWNGKEDASWKRTLCSALAQTYPYREIIVLCMAEGRPPHLELVHESLTLLLATQPGWARDLEDCVHGDYVQWLLPGESMHADKVQKMVAFFEMQDYVYAAAFATGLPENDSAWQPGRYIPIDGPLVGKYPSTMETFFLQSGCHPVGGLCAGLFRRTGMSAAHWIEPYFLDGQPMVFVMWCGLMQALGTMPPEVNSVAILRDDDCDVPEHVTPDAFCWHHLQWASALQMAEESPETADAARAGWKAFVSRGGAAVREQGNILASSPLYSEYLRLLEKARDMCE